MRTVLVVGDAAHAGQVAEALALRELAAQPCALEAVADGAGASGAGALVAAPAAGVAPQKLVAQLQQALRAGGCPPIVVALGRRDANARDLCLIGGAHDVSLDGQPEDVAARVDAAVNGWLRAGPKRPLVATFRAQRGRQPLELKVCDIDPSGVGLSSADGLVAGELLRLAVPLPGGELVAWGRVSQADGAPGVRFLALVPEERQRIVQAIQLRTRGNTVPPTMLAPPPAPQPVPQSVRPAGTPVAPSAGPVTPSAPLRPLPPPPAPAPEAPPPAPAALSIEDAIGDALADSKPPVEAAPAPAPAAEGDMLAGALASALEQRRWPTLALDAEQTLSVLQAVATEELVGEVHGAPSPAIVVEFVRSTPPFERRLFEKEPPTEFGDPAHARRCLALRLRLFALQRDGEARLAEAASGWIVDETLLGQLAQEVKDASAELQKTCDALVAGGQPQRLKDINQFRNHLQKALTDLRTVAGRMKGEQVLAGGNTALLDVAERVPGEAQQQQGFRREQPKEAPKKAEKLDFQSGVETTPAQRQRRRIIGWSVALVALIGVAVATWEPGPTALGAAAFEGVPNVTNAVYFEEKHAAVVIVTDQFQPTRFAVEKIEKVVGRVGAERFSVTTAGGTLILQEKLGSAPQILARPAQQ